jgi:lipid II:glycine glycyltransferase (peptidoglycan interpeptide bridge formation enzyme)
MDAFTWNSLIALLPGAHVLQTWEWGQVKAAYGWQPFPKIWEDSSGKTVAAGLILQRSIRLGGVGPQLKVIYLPKGPLLDWSNPELRRRILSDLQTMARQRGVVFVKIDPDVVLGTGVPGLDGAETPVGSAVISDLEKRGWCFSSDQIQFRNTVLIDLTPDEDDIQARMKQKTRYNIHLAERKGVRVRSGSKDDLSALYRMYAETSVRDGFVIRSENYYRTVWETFMGAGMAQPLIAEVDSEAIAALMLFHFAGRAWYIYGMSRQAHREKMPNYLLQWEAIRRAKAAGCLVYDLWGAPDVFDESDSMWNVYRFKEGFGGTVSRTLGAWDFTAHPFLYRLYTQFLPRLLDVMRRRGKAQTRQEVTAL